MSGTGASLIRPSAATLPVPSVGLAKPRDPNLVAYNPSGLTFSINADGDKLFMDRMPLFTAVEIPDELFNHDLRLELMMYRAESRNQGGGVDGYRHPAHAPDDMNIATPFGVSPVAPRLPNSRFRGGNRNGQSQSTTTTEWSVTRNGQRFFIDSLGQFWTRRPVYYVDAANNGQNVMMNVPTNGRVIGAQGAVPQHSFMYSRLYRPNYFAFRYSIEDPNDSRGQRITGPWSRVIKMASAVHPFVQDAVASSTFGRAVGSLDSKFVADTSNCWFETRLPSNS